MAYQFLKDPAAKVQFNTDVNSTNKTTLAGINASLSSADTICDGLASLMAIGGNSAYFADGIRTSTEQIKSQS